MKKNKRFEWIGFAFVCIFALLSIGIIVYTTCKANLIIDGTLPTDEERYTGHFLAWFGLFPLFWGLVLVYVSLRYFICETTHTPWRTVINIICLAVAPLIILCGVLIFPFSLYSLRAGLPFSAIFLILAPSLFFSSLILRVSYWIYRATHRHLFDH